MLITEEEEAQMHALEEELIQAHNKKRGLPFQTIAEGLDQCASIGKMGKKTKTNLITGLMQEAMAHPENPTLHIFALLRVLLPSRDSRSVYGFKTTSLIRSFAKAIEKEGGISGKAAAQELLGTIKEPLPDESGPYFVSTPELAIARAHGKCFSSYSRGPALSLIEVASLCQRLTNTYKERHKQAVLTLTARMGHKTAMHVHIDSVAEVLGSILSRLSYVECKVLVKLLLRTVPMGIGPNTVMEALGPYLASFLDVQQDLSRLALAIMQQERQLPALLCGVPITPMTCHTTSSPYLLKWLFTKQDTVKRYLTPKQGQVIFHSLGAWYVPIKSSGPSTGRNRFVDLESNAAIAMKTRRQHMLILREIRRHNNNPPLLLTDSAYGYLISYMLYLDDQSGDHVMLLQGARPLNDTQVEFVDASVVLDDPKQQQMEVDDDDEKKIEDQEDLMEEFNDDDDDDWKTNNKLKKNPKTKQKKEIQMMKQKKTMSKQKKMTKKASIQAILESMVSTETMAMTAQTPRGNVRVTWIGAQTKVNNNNNRATPETSSSSSISQPQQKGVLAQRKMDGDRLQAHIMQDSKGKPMVKLFTKRGRPVHTLYSDVAEELKQAVRDQPCILDGEIVVVDPDTGKPLPWSSSKWRYDSGNGKTLSELIPAEKKSIITVVEGAGSYGYNPDDQEDSSLTFAPNASALTQWSELGESERVRLKVKALPRGKLLFIVFDVLMYRGMSLVSMPCSQRLEKLKAMTSLKKLHHTKIIDESWFVKNAEELIQRLGYIVKERGEGLVLKNPEAPYEFTRSMHQRKLKICGPDINCGVVGLGFTLSRNPRLWGLLTCIQSGDSAKLLVYNRVETIEGDCVRKAAQHIHGLASKVCMHDVLHNSSSEKPIQVGPYRVFVTKLKALSVFSVTWLAIGQERCTLYFLQGIPKDIQWLCNPFDCRFGLSQRGDLYPVDWRSGEQQEEAEAAPLVVLVPRFPVGRIQLDDHQRSKLDTPMSIEEKFKEAADEKTCIQGYISRKIAHLRSKPPHPKKMEELRRILTAMEDPKETWPKVCPSTFYLRDVSEMLKKQGHSALSGGERMVLSGIPKASQWDPLRIQEIPLLPVPLEQEEDLQGKFEAEAPGITKRLWQLKSKLKRPVLLPFTRTGTDIQALLYEKDDDKQEEKQMCFANPLASIHREAKTEEKEEDDDDNNSTDDEEEENISELDDDGDDAAEALCLDEEEQSYDEDYGAYDHQQAAMDDYNHDLNHPSAAILHDGSSSNHRVILPSSRMSYPDHTTIIEHSSSLQAANEDDSSSYYEQPQHVPYISLEEEERAYNTAMAEAQRDMMLMRNMTYESDCGYRC